MSPTTFPFVVTNFRVTGRRGAEEEEEPFVACLGGATRTEISSSSVNSDSSESYSSADSLGGVLGTEDSSSPSESGMRSASSCCLPLDPSDGLGPKLT